MSNKLYAMLEMFKRFFTPDPPPEETVDISTIIQQIRNTENTRDIPLGRRIHSFHFKDYQIALDRDISKHYRVTVYLGKERIYSFTIFAHQGDYEVLKEGYKKIVHFLNGDLKITELPDNEKIKGFFYGY